MKEYRLIQHDSEDVNEDMERMCKRGWQIKTMFAKQQYTDPNHGFFFDVLWERDKDETKKD